MTRFGRRGQMGCALVAAGTLLASELKAADLVWSASEATLKVAAKEKSAVAEFAFRNTGTKTVKILSVAPSCDCVKASADKTSYAPGETGIVRLVFTVGGRQGREEKSVNVFTDDAPDHPKRLLLTVDIPEPVAIRPRMISWKTGEPASEKAIEVVLAEPESVVLGEVQCAEPTFTARWEPLEKSGHYRVQVKPISTAKLVQATIRLNAMVDGQPRVYVISAGVK